MVGPNELTQAQISQLADWNDTIITYEIKGQGCFSPEKIQELLNQIQDFISEEIPDQLFQNIKKVTDAIYEASLVLAETERCEKHLRKASQLLYVAIKELCKMIEFVSE